MILIAEAGSTKCDWIVLNKNKQVIEKTQTKGFNPSVFDAQTLANRLTSSNELQKYKETTNELHFYSAGCGTQTPKQQLEKILSNFFSNATINVKEDIYSAVFSVTSTPAIVCILGTGSNCCYFDGSKVHNNIPSLGYTIMDEASGNYFGKRLLQDYFYKKMPTEIAKKFEKQFDLNPDTIKLNLYQKEQPNTYLASFAKFIFTEKNSYFNTLISKGIQQFFNNHISQFPQAKNTAIHFVGSIAYFCKETIKEIARKNNYTVGEIIQKPIDGLVRYHQQ